jgi:hypothetical protein
MTEIKNSKPYDLEDRTQKFAREVCDFVSIAPKTMVNIEILKQLIRSAGSVGANYRGDCYAIYSYSDSWRWNRSGGHSGC